MDSKEVLFARCNVSAKTSRVDCWTCQCWIGSYAEGHVLSSASLWKQVWMGKGKYTASTDILEKVGERHTLIETILLHFWHFLFSVRTHRFRPWWKMLRLRDTNIFSDWSCCCLRTMGHWKVLNIPIYFLRKRSCYNVVVDFCHKETHPVFPENKALDLLLPSLLTGGQQQQAGLGFGKHPGFQG